MECQRYGDMSDLFIPQFIFVKKNFLLVIALFVSITHLYGQTDPFITQVTIPFGNQEGHIRYPELNDVGDMDIDEDGNIFIADWVDSSIKKFNSQGKYLGKLKQKGVQLLDVVCYDRKLYSFDMAHKNNDLYIFSTDSLRLIEKKKHIFSGYLPSVTSSSFHRKMIFKQFRPFESSAKYHIVDLSSGEIVLNLKSPFDAIQLSDKEREFLKSHATGHTPTQYLGKVNRWLLFQGGIGDPDYRIAFFKVCSNEHKMLQAKLKVSDLGNVTYGAPQNHWRFKKNRWLYFLGYRDDMILISKIDLKKLFPEVYEDNK